MLPRWIHVVAHLAFRNTNVLIASQFQLLYLQTVVRALLAAVPPMAPAPLHMLTLLLNAALQSSTGNAWLI